MNSPILNLTKSEFEVFKLGMSQVRPVHILTCFDGDNLVQVERHYPIDPLPYYKLNSSGQKPICKHCKHPETRWYLMNEELYGKHAYLCSNCEQISYLKG